MRGPLRRGVRVRSGRGSGCGDDSVRIVHGLGSLIVLYGVKKPIPLDSCCECVGRDIGGLIILPRESTTYFGVSVKIVVCGFWCVDGCRKRVGRVVEGVVDGRVVDGGVGLYFASYRRPLCGERHARSGTPTCVDSVLVPRVRAMNKSPAWVGRSTRSLKDMPLCGEYPTRRN